MSTSDGEGERERVDRPGPERQASGANGRSATLATATASRISFHAEISSSDAPRTPAPQRSDMTRLCAASPTTKR